MKFYVPTIGSQFRLTKPWEFILYNEYRNSSLFKAFGPHRDKLVPVEVFQKTWGGYQKAAAYKFALPAGTLMAINRIYIRQNQTDFDSITMRIFETTHPFILHGAMDKNGKLKASKARFWVKLCDFNNIEADIVEDKVIPHKLSL